MAGKINFIQPLGHNPYGDNHNSTQLPQQYGATIFGAGSLASTSGYGFQPSLTQAVPVAPTARPAFSTYRVDVNATGDMGAIAPMPGGKINQMQAGQYIMMGSMKELAGSGNNLLNTPARWAWNPTVPGQWRGDEETGIPASGAWDYVTGKLTLNGRQGHWFGAWNPITNQSGITTQDYVPGHLVFMVTGQVPSSSVYGPINGTKR
jgi:hypothetical protein